MDLIECNDNQKEIWNKFIAENDSDGFLQSWEWGEFQKKAGRKIWRLALFEGSELLAAAFIARHDLDFFGNYLYCPRGPIIDKLKNQNEKSKILDRLFAEIKKISKGERSLFLKIEPAVTKNMEHAIWNVLDHGFRKSNVDIQPKNTLVLDLAKSREDLLKEMKQKTRYNIRLAEKKGVRISVSFNYGKDFPRFWKLIEETSGRNEIVSHHKDYYLKMLENLVESQRGGKCDLFARLYLAEHDGKIIAGNIVLFFGDLSIYLHGASSNEDRAVMAPYFLQWRQIMDAKDLGYKKYDFWGISLDGEKESWEGITRFKKGFGGAEKKYIGAFDMAYDKYKYFIYRFIRKARNMINLRQ